jgi:glycogen debranching enzyme
MTRTGATGPVLDIRDVQVIKDDRTFLVTDRMGDVPEGNTAALGLYHRDTRFLSDLRLDVNGLRPILLHSSTERNYSQIVELTYPFEAIDVDGVHRKENVSVQRFRVLSRSLFERIRVRNFGTKVRELRVTVDFDADFVDVFEVRGLHRERRGQRQEPRVERSRVALSSRGLDGEVRTTTIGGPGTSTRSGPCGPTSWPRCDGSTITATRTATATSSIGGDPPRA